MKQHYLLLSAMVTAVTVGVFSLASSSGQTQALAGSPISGGNTCTNCHGGTVNSGPGTIEINGLPAEYVPGNTYALTLSMAGESSNRLGFQTVALDATETQAGSFGSLSSGVGTFTSGGATFLEHTSPSSSGSWSFDWTAPAAGTGTVTLYTAINATNANFSTNGDNVYNERFTLNESSASSIGSLEQEAFKVYPNPTVDVINLSLDFGQEEYRVYTLMGQTVKQGRLLGKTINLSDLPEGTYFLSIGDRVSKVVKH